MDVNQARRQLGIRRIADFEQSSSAMRESILAMLDAMSTADMQQCLAEVQAIAIAAKDRLPIIQIIANLGINEFNSILAEWLANSNQEDGA